VILTRLGLPSEDYLGGDTFVELVITLLLAKGYEKHELPWTLRQFNLERNGLFRTKERPTSLPTAVKFI
jgi:hypothetical protein